MNQTNYISCDSGGGFRGEFQRGIRDVYRSFGIESKANFGISVGALGASMDAMGKRDVERHLWEAIAESGPGSITVPTLLTTDMKPDFGAIRRTLIPESELTIALRLASKKGRQRLLSDISRRASSVKAIASNAPLFEILYQHVRIADFRKPFFCGAVSLTDGQYYLLGPQDFDDDRELAKFIGASATMPIVWEPVSSVRLKSGRVLTNLVDGGLWNNSPLSDCISYINSRADNENWHILINNCSNGYLGEIDATLNLAQIATRSLLDIALSAIFEGDVQAFLRVNHLVKQSPVPLFSESGKRYRHFDFTLIQPDGDELGETLDSSPAILKQRYELGRKRALAAVGDMKV